MALRGVSYTTPSGGITGEYTQSAMYRKRQMAEEGRAASANRLTSSYQKMAEEAEKRNVAREKEIRSIYSNILNSISGSNSSLRASGLADIETQSKKLVGQESQQMISSGLYGTTTAASIPTRVESSFAQPARLKLEDMLATRKREAQLGLAGFAERIETPYPDYNALMQANIAARS